MVYDKLVNLMVDKLGVDATEISMDTVFKEDLGVDSLDLYELAMAIEEEFGEEIPQDKMNDIYTVENIVKILKELGVED